MESGAFAILSIILVVSLARNTACMPRSSTVVPTESLQVQQYSHSLNTHRKFDRVIAHEPLVPGRLWCQHKGPEPVQDKFCEGHCIPKGYSYGLCINNMCSCI